MPAAFAQQRRLVALTSTSPTSEGEGPVTVDRYDVKLRQQAARILSQAPATAEAPAPAARPTLAIVVPPSRPSSAGTRATPASTRSPMTPDSNGYILPASPNPRCTSSLSQPAYALPVAQSRSVRPSSATSTRKVPPASPGDEPAVSLRRVQSASVLRREQRRAAVIDAAVTAASQASAACRGANAASADAASVRAAAAYEPMDVASVVPSEHRSISRLPLYTGHEMAAVDRDHAFRLDDDGGHRLQAPVGEARCTRHSRPSSATTSAALAASRAVRPNLVRAPCGICLSFPLLFTAPTQPNNALSP